MLKKNIITLTFIFIGLSGIIGCSNSTDTPQYSWKQIQKSINNKDRLLFDKYVDSDQLIDGAVKDIANLLFEQIELEESADDSFFSAKNIMSGLNMLLQPAIKYDIAKDFDEFWENETEACFYELYCLNLEFIEIAYLKEDENVANLGIKTTDLNSGEIIIIEFKLIKFENYWRVTRVANLEEMLQNLTEGYINLGIDGLEQTIDKTIESAIKQLDTLLEP
jgi:hypothetical protein